MGYDDRRFTTEEVDTGGFIMSAKKAQHSDMFMDAKDAIAESKEKVLIAFGKWLDGEDDPFETKEGA